LTKTTVLSTPPNANPWNQPEELRIDIALRQQIYDTAKTKVSLGPINLLRSYLDKSPGSLGNLEFNVGVKSPRASQQTVRPAFADSVLDTINQ
jgi:hypothetical protein